MNWIFSFHEILLPSSDKWERIWRWFQKLTKLKVEYFGEKLKWSEIYFSTFNISMKLNLISLFFILKVIEISQKLLRFTNIVLLRLLYENKKIVMFLRLIIWLFNKKTETITNCYQFLIYFYLWLWSFIKRTLYFIILLFSEKKKEITFYHTFFSQKMMKSIFKNRYLKLITFVILKL